MVRSPLRVAVVTLSLLVLTNGPLFLVARRVLNGTGNWEDPVVRSPIEATALISFGLVALDGQRVSGRRLARPSMIAAGAIAVYSLVAVLSTYWSLAPELTLWRAVTYLGLAFLAWVVADLDDDRWRLVLTIVLFVAMAASLAMLVVSPSIALDINDDWRGIYTNRNSLAPLAALGTIAGVGFGLGSGFGSGLGSGIASVAWRQWVGRALAVMSVVVLLGTGSRTSWLALLIAIGIATLVVGVRPLGARVGTRRAAMIVGSTGGVSVAALAFALHLLWSESTFEQRRTIWSQAWDSIRDRPIRGHGFFAVWEVPAFIAQHPLFERGSAHGSALEVWLGLGLLGLIPFAVIVGMALRGAWRDAWTRPSPASWVWLAAIVFLVIENITESFVLWFSYNWVLVMAAALRSGMTRSGPSGQSRGQARQADPNRPGTTGARSASAQPAAALP